MKQILTTLVTLGALSLASAAASASLPSGDILELESRSTTITTTLNARDALGMVAQCYGDSGYYRGGSRSYGYAPARRSSYYRGGGGVNVSFGRGGYGVPYGRSYRGYGSGYGRGYGRGYGGSGVGLFLNF